MVMARIKHTKNELKAQRDALRRFQRYLPTLLLKKQQLQVELRQIDSKIEEKAAEETAIRDGMSKWVRLFSEPVDLSAHLRLDAVRTSTGNIAGVSIPILLDVSFLKKVPDLFATPPWMDDALFALEKLARLRAELDVLREQHRLLGEELRTTSQRVNLFEKVKIPECEENIRVIRIFLGDLQTADVARAKIAKGKSRVEAQAA
jgi:V/A-type H+-transporting ATPase subunit D